MLPPTYVAVLRQICDALSGTDTRWAITGSLGFALQGIPVEPHDIDIQTDEAGAYMLAHRLAPYIVRPVALWESARMRSHFGILRMEGLTVEVMGAIQKRQPDGAWEPPVNLEHHRRGLVFEDLSVYVLSLAYERGAYAMLGRTATVQLLDAWLRDHPAAPL